MSSPCVLDVTVPRSIKASVLFYVFGQQNLLVQTQGVGIGDEYLDVTTSFDLVCTHFVSLQMRA